MSPARVLQAILSGRTGDLEDYTGLKAPTLTRHERRDLSHLYTTALRMALVEDQAMRILDRGRQPE